MKLKLSLIFNLLLSITVFISVWKAGIDKKAYDTCVLELSREIIAFKEFMDNNEFRELLLTAYNSHVNQTDDTPHITASGAKTSYQTIALSRDLIRHYNNPNTEGFNYGDTVLVIMSKKFIIEDTMHRRHKNRGDIWTCDYDEAIRFGINDGLLVYKNNIAVKDR